MEAKITKITNESGSIVSDFIARHMYATSVLFHRLPSTSDEREVMALVDHAGEKQALALYKTPACMNAHETLGLVCFLREYANGIYAIIPSDYNSIVTRKTNNFIQLLIDAGFIILVSTSLNERRYMK